MKPIYVALGFFFAGIGVVGIYLPLLPATPFLLLATACFARGSNRFDHWFKNTALYRKNLRPLVRKEGMDHKTKLKILTTITIFLLISFFIMKNIYGRISLIFVLLFHYFYFIFKVKNKKEGD